MNNVIGGVSMKLRKSFNSSMNVQFAVRVNC